MHFGELVAPAKCLAHRAKWESLGIIEEMLHQRRGWLWRSRIRVEGRPKEEVTGTYEHYL
jgi:hypothetical protein